MQPWPDGPSPDDGDPDAPTFEAVPRIDVVDGELLPHPD